MKHGIRVLGIDDSPFGKGDRTALVIGVVCRKEKEANETDSMIVEGVLSTKVAVDGTDGTEKLYSMVASSKFRPQLHAILINSIMLAGFNVVDISELSRQLGIPVIAITRKKPSIKTTAKAIHNTENWRQKLSIMYSAGQTKRIGSFYVQFAGTDLNGTCHILRVFRNGPIRLAHIIASGIIRGESHGRS